MQAGITSPDILSRGFTWLSPLNDSQPTLRPHAHSLQGFFLRFLVAFCNEISRLEISALHFVYILKLWEVRRDNAEDDVLVLGKMS